MNLDFTKWSEAGQRIAGWAAFACFVVLVCLAVFGLCFAVAYRLAMAVFGG